MKKTILKIMLGAIILEAILTCVFILIGNFSAISWRSLGSVGIMFIYLIPCIFYSRIYDNEKYKYIAICGASFAGVSALASILRIWDIIPEIDSLSKIISSFNVIVFLLAIISMILSFVSKNTLLTLFKNISMSLMTLLSLFLIVIIWAEAFPEGFILRLFYVLIILTAGSFIGVVILNKICKNDESKTHI